MSAELRALAEKATPGPWVAGVEAEGWYSREYWRVPVGPGKIAATRTEANAAYIAAASPDVILVLLDERDAAIADKELAETALASAARIANDSMGEARAAEAERDAAIRRAQHLDAALERVVALFDGSYTYAESGAALEQAKQALRSQESQKPPETPKSEGWLQ